MPEFLRTLLYTNTSVSAFKKRCSLGILLLLGVCGSIAQEVTSDSESLTSPVIDAASMLPDAQIQQRLTKIFKEIEELQQVSVEVTSGVVTLSGIASSASAKSEAIELTKSTSGVIYVKDRIEQNVELEARLKPAVEKANEIATKTIQQLPLLIIALLVILIFWVLATWLSKRQLWLNKLRMNDMAAQLMRRFIKLLVIGLGIYIALEIMDATALAGAVLGVAGVAGIALGFAFRNIVENYLAGILLSMRNPFSTGDAVEIDGFKGKVVRLTSRDTVLMTFEGNHLRIPNSKIITSVLTNFTRNPLRRFDFVVGVSVDLDLVEVCKLGMDTLISMKAVLKDPKPTIVVENLGDSSVNVRFFAWIDQRNSDFAKAKSEAIRIVKEAFDASDFEMPEPTYRIQMTGTSQAEDPRKEKADHPATEPHRKQIEEQDTSADTTIDRQLQHALENEKEPNLLEETDPDKS